ncbi:MAG: sulfotransferase [Desulforhopalus sp.]
MADKLVDFIVIGAARSGTTSLFANLRAHPQIFIPLEKEICFFSDNDRYQLGPEWYMGNYFADVSPDMVTGEITPAYMLFESVAGRIHRTTPQSKLIALLRNPIDRAYSHYRFAQRLGIEERDFQTAIATLFARGRVFDDQIFSQNKEYLMFGEYGRILENYLRYFPKEQIKVLFFENFQKNTTATMKEIFEFLRVQSDFTSENFSKRQNVGGAVKSKTILKLQNWLKSNQKIKKTLLTIFPPNFLGAIDMWITRKGNVKPTSTSGPTAEERSQLKAHFENDVVLLEELLNLKAPWADFF